MDDYTRYLTREEIEKSENDITGFFKDLEEEIKEKLGYVPPANSVLNIEWDIINNKIHISYLEPDYDASKLPISETEFKKMLNYMQKYKEFCEASDEAFEELGLVPAFTTYGQTKEKLEMKLANLRKKKTGYVPGPLY